MLAIDQKTGNIIEPRNNVSEYIISKLLKLNWGDNELAERSGISVSEIRKTKYGIREKLTATKFYKLYTAFGDSCDDARKIVYPDLDLTLNIYEDKGRNDFGNFMSSFEAIKNSLDIISAKTGIRLARLKELYYRTGAPEAYELLLIEKAIDKSSGEIFEELFKKSKLKSSGTKR